MSLRCDLIIRDATILDGTGAPRIYRQLNQRYLDDLRRAAAASRGAASKH